MLTFEEAAIEAHKELAPKLKNPKDGKAFLSNLGAYAFPRFGSMPVCDVTGVEVRQAVLAFRNEKPEVARKLVMRVAAVFRWAVANHLGADNPATANALALVRIEKNKTHRKALPLPRGGRMPSSGPCLRCIGCDESGDRVPGADRRSLW